MCTLPALRPLAEVIASLENGSISPRAGAVPAAGVSSAAAPKNPPMQKRAPSASEHPVAPQRERGGSWVSFISFVKERKHQLLSELLLRVSPRTFTDGVLEIEGGAFDLSALQDERNIDTLRSDLAAFGGSATWQLRFFESAGREEKSIGSKDAAPVAAAQFAPGSVADLEDQARRERDQGIDREARTNPAVKAALATFSGSRIEKVSVIKE